MQADAASFRPSKDEFSSKKLALTHGGVSIGSDSKPVLFLRFQNKKKNRLWVRVQLTPKQDDYNKIPELQVCIAEALYDAEAVLSNPAAFKPEEIRTLRDQITSNLERAWEITGGTEDQLTGTIVQISQVVAKQLSDKK